MTNLFTQPPTGPEHTQVNEWLRGFVEIAKICVIFAGGYFSHWLLLRRDVRQRKAVFLAFMAQLIGETEGRVPGDHGKFYTDKRPNILHATASIAFDFGDDARVQFDELVTKATGFTTSQAENAKDGKGKKDLLEAFHNLKEFVEGKRQSA